MCISFFFLLPSPTVYLSIPSQLFCLLEIALAGNLYAPPPPPIPGPLPPERALKSLEQLKTDTLGELSHRVPTESCLPDLRQAGLSTTANRPQTLQLSPSVQGIHVDGAGKEAYRDSQPSPPYDIQGLMPSVSRTIPTLSAPDDKPRYSSSLAPTHSHTNLSSSANADPRMSPPQLLPREQQDSRNKEFTDTEVLRRRGGSRKTEDVGEDLQDRRAAFENDILRQQGKYMYDDREKREKESAFACHQNGRMKEERERGGERVIYIYIYIYR